MLISFLPIIRDLLPTNNEANSDRKHQLKAVNTDPPTSAELNTHALELFEQLRDKRKTVADKEEIRAFRIFSDKILKEMVTYFPRTREAFRQIRGIGPEKTEKYADDFLPIIKDVLIVKNMALIEMPL